MSFYSLLFAAFCVPAAVLEWSRNRSGGGGDGIGGDGSSREYIRFRNNFVLVNSLMMGEWAAGARGLHAGQTSSSVHVGAAEAPLTLG